MKEREKFLKNEPSLTSMREIVLEISHLKVRNLSKWMSPFRRFSASFSRKYDVIGTTQQDNEKLECNISAIFRSICLKFYRQLELSKENLLDFKVCFYGN